MNPVNLRGVVHESIKHDAACFYQVTLQIFLLAYSLGIYCDCCHKLDLIIHQKFGKIEQCTCEWQKITALWWLIEHAPQWEVNSFTLCTSVTKVCSWDRPNMKFSFWSLEEIWRSTLSENHNKVFLKSKWQRSFWVWLLFWGLGCYTFVPDGGTVELWCHFYPPCLKPINICRFSSIWEHILVLKIKNRAVSALVGCWYMGLNNYI